MQHFLKVTTKSFPPTKNSDLPSSPSPASPHRSGKGPAYLTVPATGRHPRHAPTQPRTGRLLVFPRPTRRRRPRGRQGARPVDPIRTVAATYQAGRQGKDALHIQATRPPLGERERCRLPPLANAPCRWGGPWHARFPQHHSDSGDTRDLRPPGTGREGLCVGSIGQNLLP